MWAGGCVSLLPDGFVPRRWTRAPPEVLHPILPAAGAGLEPGGWSWASRWRQARWPPGPPGGGSGVLPGAATGASAELPIEFLPLLEGEASRGEGEGPEVRGRAQPYAQVRV